MMANDFNQRLRKWEEEGWTITERKGGHLKLEHPNATTAVFCGKTPSDHRAVLNIASELRRALRLPDIITPPPSNMSISLSEAPKKKPKSSSVPHLPKHRKYFIPYKVEETLPAEEKNPIPLFFRIDANLRANIWQWQYLRMRLEYWDISLIHAIRKRYGHDDAFFEKTMESYRKVDPTLINQMRQKLRSRGIKASTTPPQPVTEPAILHHHHHEQCPAPAPTYKRRRGGLIKGGVSRPRRALYSTEMCLAAE